MIGKSGVGWVVAILTYLGLLGHWANVSEVGGGGLLSGKGGMRYGQLLGTGGF